MTLVLMQKDGQDDIYVDSTNVTAHEILGWHKAKVAIAADGQSLTVPYGTNINFDLGALKINSVQVTPSANELNNLDLNQELVIPVRYEIAPDAVSVVGVHAAVNLAAGAQNVTTAITNPDVPRTVTVKGNVSGITGNVVVTGTNINDAAITDTIALSGASEVEGVKAFKTVTNIALPARTHAPVYQVETATVAAAGTKQVETATASAAGTKQVETATVVGTVTGDGDAAVIVTAAGMTGTPKTINVAVLNLDDASAVAGKIRTTLGLDADVIALFDVGGADATVTLTRKTFAADDATLNISINNGSCSGLTAALTSVDTTAGVAVNTIGGSGDATVIVTAAGMTGSPITVPVAVLAGDTVDQVAAKIITALGLNAVIAALFTIGGTGATVTLTSKTFAADDATLNISIDNGTCTGLTAATASANTTAGVAVNTVGTSGNAAVIVTAAGMTGSPITLAVAVLAGDTVGQVAAKIITALGLNAVIAALFTIGGTGATVTLTNKSYAADDATLNISIDNDTCAGLTTAATSVDTTAGVQDDTVSAGIAKKFGLPHIVENATLLQEKVFDGSDDLGTLAVDDDEIEKNLFALDGTPDGTKELVLIYLA